MSKPDEKLQARGGDMVDDTDAFLAWLDSLPKEPNDKLKAMYAAYKATVKTAPDLAELVGLLQEARTDLQSYVDHDYPPETCAAHPSVARHHFRDMELSRRIDAALAKIKEPQK